MEIIRRITSRSRQDLSDRVLAAQPTQTAQTAGPSTNLPGLSLSSQEDNCKVHHWARKSAEAELVSFIRGQPRQEASKVAWQQYLPQLGPEEQLAVDFLATSLPWWESLGHTPGFCQLVETQLLMGLIESVGKEASKGVAHNANTQAWASARPEQYAFAASLTEKVIHQLHRGVGPKYRDYLFDLYLYGFQQIDAHFTFPSPKAYGPMSMLQYSRGDLPASEIKVLFNQRFITLTPKSPNYSEIASNSNIIVNNPLIGHLMLDVLQTGGGINHDHYIFSFAKYNAPISSIPVYRLKHKGIGEASLLEAAHRLDWTKPQVIHETKATIVPSAPPGFKPTMPEVWFQSNRITPSTLSSMGLYPYWSLEFSEIVKALKAICPEFALAASSYQLVPEICLFRSIFSPLVTSELQSEVSALAKYLDARSSTWSPEAQVALIAKHQQRALDWLVSRYKLTTIVPTKRPVTSSPSTNWCGHGDWYLLPEHIADMSKDGMSKRTIKMAGCYSVIENEKKEEVLSRFGRSLVRHRIGELGSLLVYPNPLIPHERHSKTEYGEPKYLAPEGSISPPMLIPVQAAFTEYNSTYLKQLVGAEAVSERSEALRKLVAYEKKVDLSEYTQHLLRLGHRTDHAAHLAAHALTHSTASALYQALDHPDCEVEVTEGQKKAYKMFQSYKELIEEEDFIFLETLPPGQSIAHLEKAISSMPRRAPKLFICSPGVWQPVKSWRKFSPEDKERILTYKGLLHKEPVPSASPLNPANKYCLAEPWMRLVDYGSRRVIITYDQDADQNPAVALSVSAFAQSLLDAFPTCQVCYRRIQTHANKVAKGADDFIVAHGNRPFWDTLKVSPVAPNISHGELVSQPGNSYIGYLIDKAIAAKVPSA